MSAASAAEAEQRMTQASEMLETARRIARSARRGPDLRDLFDRARVRLAGTPEKKKRLKKWSIIGGPALLIVVVGAAWLIFGPMRQPDYKKDSLKRVFSYTLLSDEFNKLSVEKRLELIGQLVQRLKGMSAGDSVVLAAFAAGIAGEARKHIEENASLLAIDMWDKNALAYMKVKPEDRAAFLDAAFLEFIHTMGAVSGEPIRQSDPELLADVRKQAARDKEEMRSGKNAPPPQALARMVGILDGNVGGHATNIQRARGQVMMQDMMRHFRGGDGAPPR
jgi:hypothetical protein